MHLLTGVRHLSMFPIFAFNLLGHAFDPSLGPCALLRQGCDFSFKGLLCFARCRYRTAQFSVFNLKRSELLFAPGNLKIRLL